MVGAEIVPWSKTPLYPVLLAIGSAINELRLTPETLERLPAGDGAIIPDHIVEVTHTSGGALKARKGQYCITIEGPRLSGRWVFRSGDLEKAALAAVRHADP